MAENVPAPAARGPALAPLPFSATKAAFWVLVAATVFRLWFITRLQLFPDEAYYWLWSKNLALSYRDKGPLVAWLIALGTTLFGEGAFGIRVFAVLCLSGTAWVMFRFAQRLYDDRTALWCLGLVLLVPLYAAEAVIMTIDPMSILSWAAAMALFWSAIHSGRTWTWIALGFVIGLGFLAKFTNGVQLASIALFLLWSKPHRKYFFSLQSILMCVAFVVAITPLLWWNVQTGWVHAMALKSRSGAGDSFGLHPDEFGQFVGGQFLVLSPLIGLGMLAAGFGKGLHQHDDPRVRLLLTQLVPLTGIFLFFSLNKAGKDNWTAPALLAGLVLTVIYWRKLVARAPRWRWAVLGALALASVMTFFGHFFDPLARLVETRPMQSLFARFTGREPGTFRLEGKLDPQRTAKGWDVFAARVQAAHEKHPDAILIGFRYQQASLMAYYLPGHPTTYLPKEKYGSSQFSLWPGFDAKATPRALFVKEMRGRDLGLPPDLLADYPKFQIVDDFWTTHEGRKMARFRIYLCTR